jgi:hypothetical protein
MVQGQSGQNVFKTSSLKLLEQSTKPRVQTPVPPKKKKNKENTVKLFFRVAVPFYFLIDNI